MSTDKQLIYEPEERNEPFEATHAKFHYHSPSPEGAARHQDLSSAFMTLAEAVQRICPNGREKAVVFTHLETAKMWASAAVARNERTR